MNTVLSSGDVVVVIEEVMQEPRPLRGVIPVSEVDVLGDTVVYEQEIQLEEVLISGRLRTEVEVGHLEDWLNDSSSISWTTRTGDTLTGWRIKGGNPKPNFRRKDGDSADYLVDFALWRLP